MCTIRLACVCVTTVFLCVTTVCLCVTTVCLLVTTVCLCVTTVCLCVTTVCLCVTTVRLCFQRRGGYRSWCSVWSGSSAQRRRTRRTCSGRWRNRSSRLASWTGYTGRINSCSRPATSWSSLTPVRYSSDLHIQCTVKSFNFVGMKFRILMMSMFVDT